MATTSTNDNSTDRSRSPDEVQRSGPVHDPEESDHSQRDKTKPVASPLITVRLTDNSSTGDTVFGIGGDYVLRYWLPAMGPTSVRLLRLIAWMDFDVGAVEYRTVLVRDLNQALGIRGTGLNDPLFRTIRRLARFRFLVIDSQPAYEPWKVTVNAYVPVVPIHLRRWPEWLTTDHNTVLNSTPAISMLASGSDSGVR